MPSAEVEIPVRFLSDISAQSYSPEELRDCARDIDFKKFGITSKELSDAAVIASRDFYKYHGALSSLHETRLGGKRLFVLKTLGDTLCIRRTDQVLRRAFRARTVNRNDEVRQLLQVIRTEPGCSIFKSDISAFFENVNFSDLIKQMDNAGFRCSSCLEHLASLNSHLVSRFGYTGLPRGLSISSTLADYILSPFDSIFIKYPNAIYYSRYVDDFCVLHHASPSEIEGRAVEFLKTKGLSLNKRKTLHLQIPSADNLVYLGYEINLTYPCITKIAKSKLSKAKKRIILSILSFLSTRDYDLLLDRLRFLSSPIKFRKMGRSVPVFGGFSRVYQQCTHDSIQGQMAELDNFLHGILCSKRYHISRKLSTILTSDQKKQLRKISFQHAQEMNLIFEPGMARIGAIKHAWKYE